MLSRRLSRARKPLFAACALACAVLLAGCDEYVHITRDRDAYIARHATWAWRPAKEETSRRGARPVTSRDVITRRQPPEPITPDHHPDTHVPPPHARARAD